jgi:hypothetical protein
MICTDSPSGDPDNSLSGWPQATGGRPLIYKNQRPSATPTTGSPRTPWAETSHGSEGYYSVSPTTGISPLVPKLHLGTPLSPQFYCLPFAVLCEGNGVAPTIPFPNGV